MAPPAPSLVARSDRQAPGRVGQAGVGIGFLVGCGSAAALFATKGEWTARMV